MKCKDCKAFSPQSECGGTCNFTDFGTVNNEDGTNCRMGKVLDSVCKNARAEVIKEFNDKVNHLKEHYTDACNMCTKMECEVCHINNIIDDLEYLKEKKNG